MPNTLTKIKASGADAFKFLQAQASNDLNELESQKAIYTSFLSPQGKIRGLACVTKSNGKLEILTSQNQAEALKADLEKYIIIEEAELELAESFEDNSIELEGFNPEDTLIKFAKSHNREEELIAKYVSFEKGCFPGQEVLSKYKNIGQKKRQEVEGRNQAKELVDQALELFAAGNNSDQTEMKKSIEEAAELLRQALKLDPKNEDAYESLGVMLGKLGQYDQAIMVMHQLEMINPQSVMAQTNLSIFYMKINDKEKAEEHKAKGTVLQFEAALKE